MTQINELDHNLTFLINSWHAPFWDNFFFDYSKVWVWFPLYISYIYIFIRQEKKQAWMFIVSMILCFLIANHVSADIIKPLVARFRPSHDPLLQNSLHIINNYRGGNYGFVSSHAANTTGLAILLSLIIRNRLNTIMLICWTLLTSYSRIYLGVHFLGDTLGGMFLGSIAALIAYSLLKYLYKRYAQTSGDVMQIPSFSEKHIYVPVWVYVATFAVMLIVSV
ncbi:MAG: phosphatase PAP2 family protein [Bacteroidota bacterium]|nr:phosphatase PAP2 family protein [Bacteroidota bacterium]